MQTQYFMTAVANRRNATSEAESYDRATRSVLVADPLMPNPLATEQLYELNIDRVVNSILLGILTYDANLLILQPKKARQRRVRADRHRGQ